jgi:hypothetical protein
MLYRPTFETLRTRAKWREERSNSDKVAALSWYGVARGEMWAWVAAVVTPVVALAVALPYHYTGTFQLNWVTHLGPIYLATFIFAVGALISLRALTQR